MTIQTEFELALARAERRALHTDFDQHIVLDGNEVIVLDEGNGEIQEALIEKIIYTVQGQLCLDDDSEEMMLGFLGAEWINEQLVLPY